MLWKITCTSLCHAQFVHDSTKNSQLSIVRAYLLHVFSLKFHKVIFLLFLLLNQLSFPPFKLFFNFNLNSTESSSLGYYYIISYKTLLLIDSIKKISIANSHFYVNRNLNDLDRLTTCWLENENETKFEHLISAFSIPIHVVIPVILKHPHQHYYLPKQRQHIQSFPSLYGIADGVHLILPIVLIFRLPWLIYHTQKDLGNPGQITL